MRQADVIRARRTIGLASALLLAPLAASAVGPGGQAELLPISPGAGIVDRIAASGGRCPTFRWQVRSEDEGGHAPAVDRSPELVSLAVWELPDEPGVEPSDLPVLEVHLPAGAMDWTPSLDRCLEGGATVAWSVGAASDAGDVRWAQPLIFRVPKAPDRYEIEGAMRVMEEYRRTLGLGEPDEAPGDSGGSSIPSRRSSPSQPAHALRNSKVDSAIAHPAEETSTAESVSTQSVSPGFRVDSNGTVTATRFVGDGSQLTGVIASSLSCSGCVGDTEASPAVQRRVTGSCSAGSAMRQINPDGSVVCEADDNATYGDVYTASVTNGGIDLAGTPFGAVDDTICFLTGVEMQDIDNSNELATCRIVEFNTAWQLQAIVSPDNRDGDVWCEMTCFEY